MVIQFIFGFVQNLIKYIKSLIMGDTYAPPRGKSEAGEIAMVHNPPISKLGDSHGYWTWKMMLKIYLQAVGLWVGDKPKECARTKFMILSTLEVWVIRREYEDLTCQSILQDLEDRYNTLEHKHSQEILF
ncbi:uncharacterized protein Dana_GF16521 [Drosophila ananassae]|uniref:Uncharacterized protein n=1 Tax=Drosophila ananassae TaxID=7217 RepID=B3M2J0_DROAN|nr:uncharacterized protein LOC6499317 [Drosophila ananassae]EDV43443.2 uncharacterized protein Dana_GF16521 [Drosophila ananassae]